MKKVNQMFPRISSRMAHVLTCKRVYIYDAVFLCEGVCMYVCM